MNITYCPHCGETLVERSVGGRQRLACPACDYIHFVNPVPGVGLLIERVGKILLVRRGSSVRQGRWALPSGYIEADESVEEAAVREALEETGLKIELVEMVGVYSFPDGPPTSGIIVIYAARPVGGELHAGDDAIEVQWFDPHDIPPLPFRTHRLAMSRWLRLQEERYEDANQEDFIIRLAENSDTEAIVDLLRRQETSGIDWRAVSQRFRESSAIQVFVAETAKFPNKLVGFVALSLVRTLTGARGWIDDMVLRPTLADESVAVALLEAAMRHGQRLNLTHLYVNTGRGNNETRAFYQIVGFRPSTIEHLRIK